MEESKKKEMRIINEEILLKLDREFPPAVCRVNCSSIHTEVGRFCSGFTAQCFYLCESWIFQCCVLHIINTLLIFFLLQYNMLVLDHPGNP